MTWVEMLSVGFLFIVVFGIIFIGIGVLIGNRDNCPYYQKNQCNKKTQEDEFIDDLIACYMLGLL